VDRTLTEGLLLAAFVIALGVLVGLGYRRARRRAAAREAGSDPAGAALLAPLTEEVRKWQAEAAYWKASATRLQRELDRRDDPGPAGPVAGG